MTGPTPGHTQTTLGQLCAAPTGTASCDAAWKKVGLADVSVSHPLAVSHRARFLLTLPLYIIDEKGLLLQQHVIL